MASVVRHTSAAETALRRAAASGMALALLLAAVQPQFRCVYGGTGTL